MNTESSLDQTCDVSTLLERVQALHKSKALSSQGAISGKGHIDPNRPVRGGGPPSLESPSPLQLDRRDGGGFLVHGESGAADNLPLCLEFVLAE